MPLLFKKTRELEAHIDEYLNLVDQGVLTFHQGLKFYLEKRIDEFENRLQVLRSMESNGDSLRRDIENKLYVQTLIPESRGDVLGLLESSDKVLNLTAGTLLEFSIEKPKIPEDIHALILDLSQASVYAVENMIIGIRTYFREVDAVRDYINKALFYEKEADRIGEKIKRIIFSTDLAISEKLHLRYFSNHIESISDEAEDVCDRLAIATVKRYI